MKTITSLFAIGLLSLLIGCSGSEPSEEEQQMMDEEIKKMNDELPDPATGV